METKTIFSLKISRTTNWQALPEMEKMIKPLVPEHSFAVHLP